MELVIDANIFISAIISINGKTRDLIFLKDFSLFAPEYLLEEVEKYKKEIITKSKLDEDSFVLALSLLSSKIKLVPFSEFKLFMDKAKNICSDPDDVEYFALALSRNIPLWSDDKKLKEQSEIKIISTIELINLIK